MGLAPFSDPQGGGLVVILPPLLPKGFPPGGGLFLIISRGEAPLFKPELLHCFHHPRVAGPKIFLPGPPAPWSAEKIWASPNRGTLPLREMVPPFRE